MLLPVINFSLFAQLPSNNQNYIKETNARVAGKTTSASLVGLPVESENVVIKYFDGLGRPLQTVTVNGNGDRTKDMIQPVAYDAFGDELHQSDPSLPILE